MKITKAINDQISYEASSANAYIAIGAWCERIGYDGSAAFFFEQAAEENGHMLKLIHYLNGVEAQAIIPAIEKPKSSFESLESTFQFGLKSEQTVTKAIYDLVDMAEKEKDRSTWRFTGGSVVWSAPINAPLEPHTVSFVINPKTMTTSDAPFAVQSSTQFMPLPPGANSKPNIVPGGKNGMNTTIVNNAMVYLPATVDGSGNAKTFPPNGNLTLTGTEQYLNSGWILPKGAEHIFPGSSNTFTVMFSKAGTYSYTCILHPWMAGTVVVK